MEANKKVSQIFARSKNTKNPSLTNIESQAGQAMQDIISHFDGDNKRIASFIEINRVIEIKDGK